MSISIHTDSLTTEQKHRMIKELSIEQPQGVLHGFKIHEDTDVVAIPFHYGRNVLSLPFTKSYPRLSEHAFNATLRDYQAEQMKPIIQHLNKKSVCLLSLHVGWGKSIFSLALAHKIKLRTLIVVNKIMLQKQWLEMIQTICPDSTCQVITPKKPAKETDYSIINISNIDKRHQDFYAQFGTVLCDEVHLLLSPKGFPQLLTLTPRFLIALSATPYRKDELNKLMPYFFGRATLTKKLIRHYKVHVIKTGFTFPIEHQSNGGLNWNAVLDSQANHSERNRLIVSLLAKYPDRRFLVLCKRISQGNEIHEFCTEVGISSVNITGANDDFSNERVIIATTKKFGTGVSVDDLDALILACDVEAYYIQYLGRVFRKVDTSPLIFDLYDDLANDMGKVLFNNPLKKHLNERLRVYKESGGSIAFPI